MTIMTRDAANFWWNLPIKGIERKPFKVPNNVVRYEKNLPNDKWKVITREDIFRKRTNKINANIEVKRRYSKFKPCIVWVFSNEDSFVMGGYYTMIKTIDKEYYLNFRNRNFSRNTNSKKLREEVMQIFPFVLPFEESFYKWMELFSDAYKNRKLGTRKIQGLTFAYCKIDENGNLEKILKTK